MKNGKHPSQEKIPALAKEQLDVELDDLEVCDLNIIALILYLQMFAKYEIFYDKKRYF